MGCPDKLTCIGVNKYILIPFQDTPRSAPCTPLRPPAARHCGAAPPPKHSLVRQRSTTRARASPRRGPARGRGGRPPRPRCSHPPPLAATNGYVPIQSVREHAASGGVPSWDAATMMRPPSTCMHTSVSGHSRGCGGPSLDCVAHRHDCCSSNAKTHGRSHHAYRAAVSALTHAVLRAARAEACAPKPRRLMAVRLPGLSERQLQHVAPQAAPARTTINRSLTAGGIRGCSIQGKYVSNGKTHHLDPSESIERQPSAAAGAFPMASTSGTHKTAGFLHLHAQHTCKPTSCGTNHECQPGILASLMHLLMHSRICSSLHLKVYA